MASEPLIAAEPGAVVREMVAPRAMAGPAQPNLVLIRVNPPRPSREVALIWCEGRPYSPAVEAFKSFVFEHRGAGRSPLPEL